mgnify:CR=1 FL=1
MKIDKYQFYTTEEVAKILKVSAITIKRYISKNKIPSIKFNGLRRINGDNLLRSLEKNRADNNKS